MYAVDNPNLSRGNVVPGDHAHHDDRHLALLYGVLDVLSEGVLDAL